MVKRTATVAALLLSLGCGAARATPQPAGTGLPDATLAAERLRNLGVLHPSARALIVTDGEEQAWAHDGRLALPRARCAGLVETTSPSEAGCLLVALGAGRAAVLVARDDAGCASDACLERSWVFLRAHARPLRLPARRSSDYRALASELPRERAGALWLAGFRAYDDARIGASEAPADHDLYACTGEAPRLDYARCTLSADERELLCAAAPGELLAIDPVRGTERRLLAAQGGH